MNKTLIIVDPQNDFVSGNLAVNDAKEVMKNIVSELVDDDCDMLPTQLDNFIQTDFRVGLTEDNVNKAIKILNRYDEH